MAPTVLVRVEGQNTSTIIDRKKEIISLYSLSKTGLAPKIYGRFKMGLVYEFLKGSSLTPTQLKDPEKYPLIAQYLAKFHSTARVDSFSLSPSLFNTIENWSSVITKNEEIAKAIKDIGFSFETAQKYCSTTKELVKDSRITFCHNDLLSGNIISDPENGEITFIDFEYGSYNYPCFDIANHFCEMMGFEMKLDDYPSVEFQRKWIEIYLKSFFQYQGEEKSDPELQGEVEEFQKSVEGFAVLSHLFWGVWSFVQHQNSTNNDMDYLQYAKDRLSSFVKLSNQQN